MTLTVNGSPYEFEDTDCCLRGLLNRLGKVDTKGIAVALNGTVVSRKDWGETALKEQDSVLIIQATQGG